MIEPSLIELLYSAINEPLGVVVSTNNAKHLRAKLYPLRKSDPDLARLAFVVSPTAPDTELWIVNRPEKEIAENSDTEAYDPPS